MLPKKATEPIPFDMTQTLNIPEFVEHTGNGKFQNWLGLNLPYAPFEKLKKDLEIRLGSNLIGRGEAHITVITPPEFDNILSTKLTMKQINEIAQMAKIQNSRYELLCVGQGTANIDGKTENTWYVVVKSEALLEIRKKIDTEFLRLGGKPQSFKPNNFYPHITLGFTKRDLHESDGVIKDASSCRILFSNAEEKPVHQ